ncbi:ATP-binding cassette domain-containing protein [Bifidobacterium sp. SMA15]|uniref:ATP-binding cassette domain-containing protein n=1 Tax=Bifidobacterium platyrrhinorum TaxID=2661628 RepID=A0A6L9STN5_9BIFI|nr:ATP-binding cassette domain-containing protein [Bifidobacterium platyrrhinorum]
MTVDIADLHISLGMQEIVHGVDLHIGDGERVGLIGPSGSGKSMIAKSLLGLLPREAALSGAITMGDAAILAPGAAGDGADDFRGGRGGRDGRDGRRGGSSIYADERTLADLRGRYVGAVFQNPTRALNPVMTIAQIIGLPLYLHYDLTLAERVERIKAMLDKVGLPQDTLLKRPHELSGGQRQRVGIAAALVTSPRLIIADEPTTALDSITQRQIVDLLVSLVDDAGASMLFITHDFAVLQRATTRCYVLDAGLVVESGATAGLLAAPKAAPTRELVSAARTLTLHSDMAGMAGADGAEDDASTLPPSPGEPGEAGSGASMRLPLKGDPAAQSTEETKR